MPNLPTTKGYKACTDLTIGESFRLDTNPQELCLFFDWKLKDSSNPVDVDASAALFDKGLRPCGFVWWDNLLTIDESVRFVSADDQSGTSSETKEKIIVKTKAVPTNVAYILLVACVYSKDHNMTDIVELSVTVRDAEQSIDLVRHTLKDNLEGRSILMGCLARSGEFWAFQALSVPMISRTISELTHEPSNLTDVKNLKVVPKTRRRIKFTPVEGRDLTPMDFSLFTKRSDPYLKIFYENKVVVSEVCYETLNPTFNCPTIYFGEVAETNTNVVEIQVWDYDRFTAHDNMGVAKFCLGGLVPNLFPGDNRVLFKVFPLKEHLDAKKKITGQIVVVVNCEEFV